MPLALAWLVAEGGQALARLLLALVVSGGWHLDLHAGAGAAAVAGGGVTALAIAMLAPEELGLVRLVLGISFGVVIGELVFGGWGRNVVNPATVTLAFLGFGFPPAPWPGSTCRSPGRRSRPR